jgi:ATP-binding cassette subfamily B protein
MFRRHACVRQRDLSDCGAAALATLALHHGRPIGLEAMRDLAGTDRIGTNLLGLVQAAERLGFAAKAVKGHFEALAQVPLPAIAHVKTEEGLGHFLVLHRTFWGVRPSF